MFNWIKKIFKKRESFQSYLINNGIKTKYSLSLYQNTYTILFNSSSNREYQFNLIKESNSIYQLDRIDYQLNEQEFLEIFNRIISILKELTNILNISEYYIESTSDDNIIYKKIIKFKSGWEKRKDLYFKL